jgi:hypothetical protein
MYILLFIFYEIHYTNIKFKVSQRSIVTTVYIPFMQ